MVLDGIKSRVGNARGKCCEMKPCVYIMETRHRRFEFYKKSKAQLRKKSNVKLLAKANCNPWNGCFSAAEALAIPFELRRSAFLLCSGEFHFIEFSLKQPSIAWFASFHRTVGVCFVRVWHVWLASENLPQSKIAAYRILWLVCKSLIRRNISYGWQRYSRNEESFRSNEKGGGVVKKRKTFRRRVDRSHFSLAFWSNVNNYYIKFNPRMT